LLNHRDFQRREDLDQQIVQTLRQYEVEWVIMAGWMRLVTPVLIDAFPTKLLISIPACYRVSGCPRSRAGFVNWGENHWLYCSYRVFRSDSGPILLQAAVPVLPDDTPETLHARIQVQEHRILPPAIALAAGIKTHGARK